MKESLEFAHNSIKDLIKRVEPQETALSKLTKDLNTMSITVTFERERAIKLESHSRRNSLIFYNIPEEENETTAMTEDTLYIFMEEKLKMEEEEASNICIERGHRLGKRKDDNKPRPIIAKFSFHKDKERILSKAYKLAGTGLGISQDFPQEIVEIRKGLIKVLKDAKKEGREAKLVYDKLYIDGRRYRPSGKK